MDLRYTREGGVAMSTPILHQLALLEGTPASIAEAQARFGISLEGVASLLVAVGYHDAKRACMSQDPQQQAKGRLQMVSLADACHGLSNYYMVLGQTLAAAQAAEIEGTAAAFAGDEQREKELACDWCLRLTGESNFSEIIKKANDLEGDWFLLAMKFVSKLAKYIDLPFDQRWGLVSLMATKKHPDTLGRALWACEIAYSTDVELMYMNGLNANGELLSLAKPEQRERFQARIAELEGAPKP